MRLTGHYDHTLDDKGRLAIPAKFRDRLGDTVILTVSDGMYILGYPLSEWESLEEGWTNLSATLEDDAEFLRIIYSQAVDCEIDKRAVSSCRPDCVIMPRSKTTWSLREWVDGWRFGAGRIGRWSRPGWLRTRS